MNDDLPEDWQVQARENALILRLLFHPESPDEVAQVCLGFYRYLCQTHGQREGTAIMAKIIRDSA